MRKYLLAFFIMTLLPATTSFAEVVATPAANCSKPAKQPLPEEAKPAVRALKKLEARCEVGISQKDYFAALGDSKFEVNLYLRSDEGKNGGRVAELIGKAMEYYQQAADTMTRQTELARIERENDLQKLARLTEEGRDQNVKLFWSTATAFIGNIDNEFK